VGLSSALTLYINTYFWELSSAQLSVLTLPLFLSALFAVALAPVLSVRLGKKRAALLVSVTALLVAPAPIVLRLLGLFPANDTPLLLPSVLVFNVVTVTLIITSGVLTASMGADLAEDSEVATGRRSEGVFVAANTFVQKTVSGIGIFASSLLLAAVGFPRDARPGAVDPDVIWRLGFVYVTLLVTVYAIAIGFLAAYRISRETHEANLERLAGRG
jgi:Na+/melibiose symporter-like transporter